MKEFLQEYGLFVIAGVISLSGIILVGIQNIVEASQCVP